MRTESSSAAPIPVMEGSSSQTRYQVRVHVGVASGELAAVVADAHVVVLADALPDGIGDELASSPSSVPADALVLAADFRVRSAAARAVLDEQARRGDRAMVAIVTPQRADGQFAVEDFLLAGAVVDALATLGIDYSSPEAAAACAAFTGLRGAVGHLVSASAAGQEWVAQGRAAELRELCAIDSEDSLQKA